MITARLERWLWSRASGESCVVGDGSGEPVYMNLPAIFVVNYRFLVEATRWPPAPRIFLFWPREFDFRWLGIPLTSPGWLCVAVLIKLLGVAERWVFWLLVLGFGLKPEYEGRALIWGALFGEEFPDVFSLAPFRWAVGRWDIRVVP